ncbi:MAG: hypothetical protein LBJ11_10655 [Oscillospiraceae bacterium]|jgi:hypothetical protein|nr:hypothetical protein [Oscillospiraceae bacterium]
MNKTTPKRKNLVVIISALVLSAIIGVSATFAWVSARHTIVNQIKNEGYAVGDSVVGVENFNPDIKPMPGEKTTKEYAVTNAGNVPVLVRVAFEEYLQTLGNNGDITWELDPTSVPAGTIRAKVDERIYASTATPAWTEITTSSTPIAVDANSHTIPANVRFFNLGNAVRAVYEYATGEFQSVQAKFTVYTDNTNPSLPVTSVRLDSDLKFGFFTWTNSVMDGEAANPTRDTAFFYSWNAENNVKGPSPLPDWSTYYTLNSTKAALADIAHSQLSSSVLINYNTTDASFSTIAPDTWYYFDGYFYYMAALDSGATTPNLTSSIEIAASASQAFQTYDYQLAITVEAVQAIKAAVSDGSNGGWGISDALLLAALQGYCA